MEKYQPVPIKTRIKRSMYPLALGLTFSFITTISVYYNGWGSFFDGDFLDIASRLFGGAMGAGWLIYSFSVINKRFELTPWEEAQARFKAEERSKYLMKKWYVRHPLAIIPFVWAIVCYVAYDIGIRWNTIGINFGTDFVVYLLINPVTGIIAAILAIILAWELFLAIIAVFVLYYLYLGIAALPVSVAIIIGSLIIAYVIYKYKS